MNRKDFKIANMRRRFGLRENCEYKALRLFLFGKTKYPKTTKQKSKKMPNITGSVNDKKVRLNISKFIRTTKAYRIWRESILNKFNHTCSSCGNKERLELDHIEPVSKRPDLIMEDTNARILCNPCHKKTDSYPKSLARGL